MPVHRIGVGEARDGSLIAEVLERGVGEVEVNALQQEVGRDEGLGALGVGYDGGIIADTEHGRVIMLGQPLGQVPDEAELPELGQLCSLHLDA